MTTAEQHFALFQRLIRDLHTQDRLLAFLGDTLEAEAVLMVCIKGDNVELSSEVLGGRPNTERNTRAITQMGEILQQMELKDRE